jgi:hypothetical protein
MGLPITCNDIINLPMDEFNDLLSKHELTEEQLTLCRDIRRRGKNKVKAKILFKQRKNIDPLPPSPPSECVLTPHKRRGYTLAGR